LFLTTTRHLEWNEIERSQGKHEISRLLIVARDDAHILQKKPPNQGRFFIG